MSEPKPKKVKRIRFPDHLDSPHNTEKKKPGDKTSRSTFKEGSWDKVDYTTKEDHYLARFVQNHENKGIIVNPDVLLSSQDPDLLYVMDGLGNAVERKRTRSAIWSRINSNKRSGRNYLSMEVCLCDDPTEVTDENYKDMKEECKNLENEKNMQSKVLNIQKVIIKQKDKNLADAKLNTCKLLVKLHGPQDMEFHLQPRVDIDIQKIPKEVVAEKLTATDEEDCVELHHVSQDIRTRAPEIKLNQRENQPSDLPSIMQKDNQSPQVDQTSICPAKSHPQVEKGTPFLEGEEDIDGKEAGGKEDGLSGIGNCAIPKDYEVSHNNKDIEEEEEQTEDPFMLIGPSTSKTTSTQHYHTPSSRILDSSQSQVEKDANLFLGNEERNQERDKESDKATEEKQMSSEAKKSQRVENEANPQALFGDSSSEADFGSQDEEQSSSDESSSIPVARLYENPFYESDTDQNMLEKDLELTTDSQSSSQNESK